MSSGLNDRQSAACSWQRALKKSQVFTKPPLNDHRRIIRNPLLVIEALSEPAVGSHATTALAHARGAVVA